MSARIVVLLLLIASPSFAQYSLGPAVELVNSSFYAGEVSDGSNVAGRFCLWGASSPDGTQVAFIGVNANTQNAALFVVQVGDPDSWYRLTIDIAFGFGSTRPLCWSPDGSTILFGGYRVPLASGQFEDSTVHGYEPFDPSVTRLPNDNWMIAGVLSSPNPIIMALPIRANGTQDLSRSPVQVTNFPAVGVSWPTVSPDGTEVSFADFQNISMPQPDDSSVYVLKNLQQIIQAATIPSTNISTLAPTSLADSNIVAIRTTETGNFAHGGNFSQDKSLIFYAEDFNNVFNDNDFFNTVVAADFDTMISQADGTGTDVRLQIPGNQSSVRVFPGGIRLMYGSGGHILLGTLIVAEPIGGTTVGNPVDNDISTTVQQTAADGSGTVVTVPAGTLVDFPMGEAQEISMNTPLNPVEEAQLPEGVVGIPVVRDFGPDGALFNPPIEITISYTDAEVAGFDESTITPYLYNSMTDAFDIPVDEADILDRDTANNRITFRVDHFSQYGLGFTSFAATPISDGVPWVAVVLICIAALRCWRGHIASDLTRRIRGQTTK